MQTPVTQALILAGGHGTRMSSKMNPQGCKCLISYRGQSMLGHLIDSLVAGGIRKFIFATNTHSDEAVRSIIAEKGIENCTVIVSDGKYRGVAYEVKHLLYDRFLMVCGHHPIAHSHIASMLKESENSRYVMSAYDNSEYTMDKKKRIIAEHDSLVFKEFDESTPADHRYVRNPYILDKDIVNEVQRDGYSQTFSYYIYQKSRNGERIGIVTANMPPEFDYDSEFERTKSFLDSYLQ